MEPPIGFFEDGIVTLNSPLTKETIFSLFGNIGYRALKSEIQDKVVYIKKFEVICWSLLPTDIAT